MSAPLYPSAASTAKDTESTTSDLHSIDTATPLTTYTDFPQIDGSTDYQQHMSTATTRHNYAQPTAPRTHPPHRYQGHRQHQAHAVTSIQAPPHQQPRATRNAVTDLLPYCTTEPPLSEAQVIALSDVVGSLKELVILALAAAGGDGACVKRLEGAVGRRAAANIVEFFFDEWEIEG